nr:hypothetical protein [Tanacetum cinerariifolium]
MLSSLVLGLVFSGFVSWLQRVEKPPVNHPTICYNDDDDDDEDCTIAITPILSTEEPDNSLSMGDEHLDTILETESDELIKSSVENLVPIPSESEGIPDNMCDVPFHDNSPSLDISKDQFEDFFDSNDDSTSIDDDSFSIDDIEYVEVSPPDSELISLEVIEIEEILLTINDDILREKLLNANLLIAKIKALKDNLTPSSDFVPTSSSTSLNFLLGETNTFDNSLPKSEMFCFDSEENSSGSTTTRTDISLPDYEAFYDDHVKEISSGSTTTDSDFSLYDSFIFDLSINPFPPADRSDFYEFADELAHIISPPEYDCFSFKNEPNSRDFTMDVVEDTFPTREPRVHVHNVLPTHPILQLNLDFILSIESLFAYVEKLMQEEQWAYLSTHPSKRLLSFCFDDDDEDYTSAITPDEPVLSTKEPDNSLSMRDEHLDTIPATESDQFIKSGVENLVPIPSESEGIPDHVCDVPFLDNSPPLDISKDTIEDFSYPEVMKIVTPEVGGIKASIDNPIPFCDPIIPGNPPNLTPSGETFLNDDHSSDFKTKSSSTSLNSLLEETHTFDNSLPEFITFSNVLCDAECKSDSSDDQSCSDEDVLEKIVSKPLSEEEIIPMESLRTHDSSLPISSKIDSLLDEFADIHLIKKLLYDNSSPRSPEEFVSANSDAAIKSFSPS